MKRHATLTAKEFNYYWLSRQTSKCEVKIFEIFFHALIHLLSFQNYQLWNCKKFYVYMWHRFITFHSHLKLIKIPSNSCHSKSDDCLAANYFQWILSNSPVNFRARAMISSGKIFFIRMRSWLSRVWFLSFIYKLFIIKVAFNTFAHLSRLLFSDECDAWNYDTITRNERWHILFHYENNFPVWPVACGVNLIFSQKFSATFNDVPALTQLIFWW